MAPRVKKILTVALLAWLAWVAVNVLTIPNGFIEVKNRFCAALQTGDVAAIRNLTSQPQDDRVMLALQARRIDKPAEVVTRGGGYATLSAPRFLWSGEGVGYHDLTVKAVDGSAVPFRLELVKGNVLFGRGWKIESVSFEK